MKGFCYMSDGKKINVMLYGDGSRNARLRKETVYCDRCDSCSVFKEGRCLKITSPFSSYCPFGSLTRTDGGTKRSKTFARVRAEAKDDECYGKICRAYNTYFAVAGDDVIVGGMSVYMDYHDERFAIEDPGFSGGSYIAIPKNEFTCDIVKKIIKFRPRAE